MLKLSVGDVVALVDPPPHCDGYEIYPHDGDTATVVEVLPDGWALIKLHKSEVSIDYRLSRLRVVKI